MHPKNVWRRTTACWAARQFCCLRFEPLERFTVGLRVWGAGGGGVLPAPPYSEYAKGTHISGGCCALLMSAICTTSRNAPSTFTASFALVSM